MRRLFTPFFFLLLSVSCRESDAVLPLDAPVASLSDLPVTYQPVQQDSAVGGRLTSEIQNGQLSGEWRYNRRE